MKQEQIRSNVGRLIPDQEFTFESPEVQSMVSRIKIKKLKFMPEMSEETLCFHCQVYIDGKYFGEASNSGHGGATCLHAPRALVKPIEEILGGLTRKIFTFPDSDREDSRWAWCLEDLIDDVVTIQIEEKEVKQWITKESRTGILFRTAEQDNPDSYRVYKRRVKVSDKANCAIEEERLFNLIIEKHPDVTQIVGFRTRSDWKA